MSKLQSDLTILYGSQTGNAEDTAKRIGHQAKLNGFQSIRVLAMDDFELKELMRQKFLLFVCSTTGHGQEPDNMKNFYNFIRRRDLPRDCLKGLKYAVYGLGNSSYAKFNYVAKILFKRLKECGAEPSQGVVLSDEQHRFGCDGLIYPKLDDLWQKLGDNKIKQSSVADIAKLSYSVKYYKSDIEAPCPVEKFREDFKSKYNMREARCMANERLTSESHFQDTRLISFEIDQDTKYYPGDVCSIYPQNSEENVQEFFRLLNLKPEQRFAVRKLDCNYMVNYLYDFVPDGLQIQDLVRYYLDIQSIPKRSFFEYLWPLSTNEMERDKLRELASTEGQEELYDYCIRPKRTILETMMDFKDTVGNIHFNVIFDLIPPIKPRFFSIASHMLLENKMQLLVGVVNYKTSMRKPRSGLCSNYLANMTTVDRLAATENRESATLRFFIRATPFKLPKNESTPVIMVGPGLGLSPFRGFLAQRAVEVKRGSVKCCENYLYFGCRHKERDYYFRDELEQYEPGILSRLRVAFSRQEPKTYVQDLMAEDSELLGDLILKRNAVVYIAGNSKLPEEIRLLLAKILVEHSGDEPENGERMVTTLEGSNRIQFECW